MSELNAFSSQLSPEIGEKENAAHLAWPTEWLVTLFSRAQHRGKRGGLGEEWFQTCIGDICNDSQVEMRLYTVTEVEIYSVHGCKSGVHIKVPGELEALAGRTFMYIIIWLFGFFFFNKYTSLLKERKDNALTSGWLGFSVSEIKEGLSLSKMERYGEKN